MFEPVRISPSILSADFMRLGAEVADVERAGADWIHVDVMDGHFVPNLTIGVPVLEQVVASATVPVDAHLMISNPLEQLPWYLAAKPDFVTIHWEALDEGRRDAQAAEAVALVHGAGVRAGIALKPDTPVEALAETAGLWDLVLIMSVFPGFSGQKFIAGTPERIARFAGIARAAGASPLIQVDGGIGPATAGSVIACGADVLVAGNAVFKAADRARAISAIREAGR